MAGAITTVTQDEVWPGLIGMRVLAVAGVALRHRPSSASC
jgi:hypothetical protein